MKKVFNISVWFSDDDEGEYHNYLHVKAECLFEGDEVVIRKRIEMTSDMLVNPTTHILVESAMKSMLENTYEYETADLNVDPETIINIPPDSNMGRDVQRRQETAEFTSKL